ncbi:thiamine-phosphate kinase [Sphingomonas gilva]|uniref:Thiamine-monophosphate kinase n=1 Tax=Sphingomonas gilva TaxID=2305907 RepID=A0A396S4N7_9SPHN|nr:thiamine-phosphate kinase [Sphingomonas gilva]RHW18395.1 thiamine-phosphate kinase [Sphingomonas gilva]
MNEADLLARLRSLPLHEAARGLADDAAVLGSAEGALVLTHDMIAEGVHFLSADPPESVAWKLLAVNLSDLAAKGASPIGVLVGQALSGDAAWDAAFTDELGRALAQLDCTLLGGDTVTLPGGAPRMFGLTAIGRAGPAGAPSRAGARSGDALYVTGTIGDAGAGLELLREGRDGPPRLIAAYRRPMPLIADGRALAPLVTAMMDVSDGLLIDAGRMAAASGLAIGIDLDRIPLSHDFVAHAGDDRPARLSAATAGDDYQLLFAAPEDEEWPVPVTRIGRFHDGAGLMLEDRMGHVPLPERLGWEHAGAT